ncbi:hypothetical protein [Endothiovibrio diazotrophicus]
MAYTFFHIRALDPQEESERLNAFLASHAVLQVDRHFVADGENSFWSVCDTADTAARRRSGVA